MATTKQPPRRKRSDGERTRRTILEAAVSLSTVEGLDGLSIGKLAAASGTSKSGLYAHFGSKEELQLATVEAARELFIDVVITPALAETGVDRLAALCESFLGYVQRRTLPGGCFFASVGAELGGRSGPVRERIAVSQREWMALLTDAAEVAVARGHLRADADIAGLVFECNALVVAANSSFILHEDPSVIERARTAVARAIAARTP